MKGSIADVRDQSLVCWLSIIQTEDESFGEG